MKRSILIVLAALGAFVLLAEEPTIDFRLEDLNGKQQKLSELQQDKLVILDFWATWCDPCKKALPKLNELHNKYDEVLVIAINMDKPRKKSDAVSHIKSNRFDFITLFDPAGNVARQFNVTSIPRTLMLSPGGEVFYDHTGYQRGDEKEYEKKIQEWLESASAQENDE